MPGARAAGVARWGGGGWGRGVGSVRAAGGGAAAPTAARTDACGITTGAAQEQPWARRAAAYVGSRGVGADPDLAGEAGVARSGRLLRREPPHRRRRRRALALFQTHALQLGGREAQVAGAGAASLAHVAHRIHVVIGNLDGDGAGGGARAAVGRRFLQQRAGAGDARAGVRCRETGANADGRQHLYEGQEPSAATSFQHPEGRELG